MNEHSHKRQKFTPELMVSIKNYNENHDDYNEKQNFSKNHLEKSHPFYNLILDAESRFANGGGETLGTENTVL